jgi:hypothetical protein
MPIDRMQEHSVNDHLEPKMVPISGVVRSIIGPTGTVGRMLQAASVNPSRGIIANLQTQLKEKDIDDWRESVHTGLTH